MTRDDRALLERLVTLRHGFGDVAGQPCLVALEVARLIGQRGWQGLLERCSACPDGW